MTKLEELYQSIETLKKTRRKDKQRAACCP